MSALYFLPLMRPSSVGFSLSLKFSVTSYTALTEKQAHDNVVAKGQHRIIVIHVWDGALSQTCSLQALQCGGEALGAWQ